LRKLIEWVVLALIVAGIVWFCNEYLGPNYEMILDKPPWKWDF